jgi:sRNA-binding regulator protein Hfq
MSRDDGRPGRGPVGGGGAVRRGPPGRDDRRRPSREDPHAKRAAEIARTTGLTIEAARTVAAGRADLNDLLKRMAFQDEVQALMARHELNRALATQIVMGQANLAQVLTRRRVESQLEANRDRTVLELALADGRELTLGLHGHRQLRARIRAVERYEVVLLESEANVEHRVHKLQIKYAYAPDDHKKVRKGLDYDKARRDAVVEPIPRPQDRYACSDRRLGLALDRKLPVTIVTLEGECFNGEIAWVSRYEFAVRTRAGGEVVIFRHALAELREPAS